MVEEWLLPTKTRQLHTPMMTGLFRFPLYYMYVKVNFKNTPREKRQTKFFDPESVITDIDYETKNGV